jgi:hypothetical protein
MEREESLILETHTTSTLQRHLLALLSNIEATSDFASTMNAGMKQEESLCRLHEFTRLLQGLGCPNPLSLRISDARPSDVQEREVFTLRELNSFERGDGTLCSSAAFYTMRLCLVYCFQDSCDLFGGEAARFVWEGKI